MNVLIDTIPQGHTPCIALCCYALSVQKYTFTALFTSFLHLIHEGLEAVTVEILPQGSIKIIAGLQFALAFMLYVTGCWKWINPIQPDT